jgi:hypothetical protein
VNRSELIRELRAEKADLVKRLEAIDAALVGFGAASGSSISRGGSMTGRTITRRSSAERDAYDQKLVDALTELGDWVTAADLTKLLDMTVNGTVYTALDRLVRQERIIKRGDHGRYEWRCMPEAPEGSVHSIAKAS